MINEKICQLNRRNRIDQTEEKQWLYTGRIIIVVAVVGILVAISLPVFTLQLHKAKVATDEANLRSYYSVLMADYQATGKYDYDPSITDDMWKNISDTIKYKDGTTVKLKAGQFSVI